MELRQDEGVAIMIKIEGVIIGYTSPLGCEVK
jgi:hypothetical protein